MDVQLSNEMDYALASAKYDKYCKTLLTHKIILAHIMKSCVNEFKDMDVDYIAENCIATTPEVSEVPLHRNTAGAAKITGLNSEDATMSEGVVYFDIRFVAVLPQTGENIKLIINLEAQNKYNPGYSLIRRALYYCCRLVSAQYGTEFTDSNYDDIKKVYSIWICTNTPENAKNTITEFSIKQKNILGKLNAEKSEYDILQVVMLCLDRDDEDTEKGDKNILKLLRVLLSGRIEAYKKKVILSNDFDIETMGSFEKEMDYMCNLSAGIWEDGMEKGMEKGIQKGMQEGIIKGMINTYHELGVSFSEIVNKIAAKFNLSMDDAESTVKKYWTV